MITTVAWQSLLSRRKTVVLTFLSLLVSISVLLSVEHLRSQAKDSFNRAISGTDLIVGAPSGELNLLLYAVFRMGSPTNNIDFSSYQMIAQQRNVAWTIPISLGDSHRGYRVLGTNNEYFEHFNFGDKRKLSFNDGGEFTSLFNVVLGAEVAQQLNYKMGDKIVIAHGLGTTSFKNHDNAPFSVSGILAPTGTAVDKTIHVSLEAIEAIHVSPSRLEQILQSENYEALKPNAITAALVGLDSKFATFTLQRFINEYRNDRLMAVLPGVAMSQLWQLMGNLENLLLVMSALVLVASLFGLTTMLLASMNERKTEVAVLRTIGAPPRVLFQLIVAEALVIATLAFISAVALVTVSLTLLSDWLIESYGLFISNNIVSSHTLVLSVIILGTVVVASILPAIEAYRKGLAVNLQ